MQTHWNNFGNSFCVVMHSLLWLSHCGYLLNTSASRLQPVLSLFHREPHIGARVSFVLQVERYFEMVLTIWEEIGKTFMEGMDLSSKSIILDGIMMVVLVVCIVDMTTQIMSCSCLVVLHKGRREMTLLLLALLGWLLKFQVNVIHFLEVAAEPVLRFLLRCAHQSFQLWDMLSLAATIDTGIWIAGSALGIRTIKVVVGIEIELRGSFLG